MRPPRLPAALLLLWTAACVPAWAQVKADLGAAAVPGAPAGAAGSATSGAASVAPPSLAPAALPSALSLPASALAPSPSAAALPAPPAAADGLAGSLGRLGVPADLTSRLIGYLDAGKPEASPSHLAAGRAAGSLEAFPLPASRKMVVILAAALHDVDARKDPAAGALVADFAARFGFAPEQVDALAASGAATRYAAALTGDPAPARAPPDVAKAKRYIASIASGIKLTERQTDGLLNQYFEEEGIPPGSTRADIVRRELLPSKVAAEDRAAAALSPALRSHRAALLTLAAERGTTPARIEEALTRRGVVKTLAALSDENFLTQTERALVRDELETAVAGYPDTPQGDFMRHLAGNMATPSGKSIEETTRSGAFAYVDFNGASVSRATTGRDPDVRSAQAVFYVVRVDGRWKIGGYRQNRRTGRSDDELAGVLRRWLISGGVPARDLAED